MFVTFLGLTTFVGYVLAQVATPHQGGHVLILSVGAAWLVTWALARVIDFCRYRRLWREGENDGGYDFEVPSATYSASAKAASLEAL